MIILVAFTILRRFYIDSYKSCPLHRISLVIIQENIDMSKEFTF